MSKLLATGRCKAGSHKDLQTSVVTSQEISDALSRLVGVIDDAGFENLANGVVFS